MGKLKSFLKKQCKKLTEKGYACLKENDYDGALKIAKELEELHYTASFEIAALTYAGMNNLEEAVKILEKGVDLAPDCWLNWQLLGNYRSNLGRYDEADTAYKNALECTNVRESSVHLNQAILSIRLDRYEDALKKLECIDETELHLQVVSARIDALMGIGRIDEASRLGLKTLEEQWDDESEGELMGYIAANICRMRLKQRENKELIREFAIKSLAYHHNSPSLLAVIRYIDAKYSPKAMYYRMFLHAKIHVTSSLDEAVKGFYVNYDVVADDSEEALEFIIEFENDEEIENLSIEKIEALEHRPDDPKGIYWRSFRFNYEEPLSEPE
ncbi:MAG: hypothetical protein NT166_27635 [Candidatus Aminicenantes bacterium]|nr:hypothetical protein [Candidatus Aminicenantes bacterium]